MIHSLDPRIAALVDQMSKENDRQSLIALSRQLTAVLDETIKAHLNEKDATPLK